MNPTRDPKIIRLKPRPLARMRLFCFPFSGASAAIFNTWPAAFPEDVEIIAVEYPGHGQRLSESLSTNMQGLVNATLDSLRPYLDLPFAFFGHSLGALLSFELARAMRARQSRQPLALFLSAHGAAQLGVHREKIASLPDNELLERIRQMNGTDDHVLDHPELRELFLPIFRADFAVCDDYLYAEAIPLECPIFALGGINDVYVPVEELAQWRTQTTGPFDCRLFAGDHFYLRDSRAALLQYVSGSLVPLMTGVRPA